MATSDFDSIDLESLSDEDLMGLAGELADLYTEASESAEFSAEEDGEFSDAIAKVDAEVTRREAGAEAAAAAERRAAFAAKYAGKNAAAAEAAEAAEAAAATTAAELAASDPDKDGDNDKTVAGDTDHDGGNKEMGTISPEGLSSEGTNVVTAAVAHSFNVILAAGDETGFAPGSDLGSLGEGSTAPDLKKVTAAFMNKRKSLRGGDKGSDGVRYLVASVAGQFPEDRFLDTNEYANMGKIDSARKAAERDGEPNSVTAAGGITVPLEPYYTLNILGVGDRPVKGAMSNFAAARGGIRYITPPNLSNLSGSTAIITSAEDAAGYGEGLTPFKPYIPVSTGPEQDVTLYAVTRQVQFGNFGARTYPEQVEAWLNLSITFHARVAEQQLLDQIKNACTSVTYAATYGASRTLLPIVEQQIVAFKSRWRTGDNIRFRVLMPFWAKALIRADIVRQEFNNQLGYDVSDAQIEHWFDIRGCNVTWYVDTPTGASQVFATQTEGAALTYPATVAWYLWVEGTMLFLDGGTLDLGLVRDSTLNSTNDYRIFVETFEAVAFVGVEAQYNVTSVVAGGAAPAGVTALTSAI